MIFDDRCLIASCSYNIDNHCKYSRGPCEHQKTVESQNNPKEGKTQ